MNTNQGDFLLTYGSICFEEHEDSSDFEGAIGGSSKENYRLLNNQGQEPPRPMGPNYQLNNMYEDFDKYPVKLRKVNHESSGTNISPQRGKIKEKVQNLNRGDQIPISTYKVQSKMSVIIHKLYPCISTLFKRSNRKDEKENPNKNTMDKCSQHCNDRERTRIKKLYKRHKQFTPVYAFEGIHQTQAPFEQIKITASKSHDSKKFVTKSSACSLSSSSESEILSFTEKHQNSRLLRRKFKSELLKERLKYQQNLHLSNQQIQSPPKGFKSPYQVFSSSYHEAVKPRVSHDLDMSYLPDMPSSSSGFWDYLFDKFNRKYTTQRVELPTKCKCNVSQTTCTAETCEYINKDKTGPTCSTTKKNKKKCKGRCECTQIPGLEEAVQTGSQTKYEKKTSQSDDISQSYNSMDNSPLKFEIKPCQEDHDAVIAALKEKYHGEILCIHNPPCILINGCLNLPSDKSGPQTDVWPVTETKKSGFREGFCRKKLKPKWEQEYQYHFVDVQKFQVPAYKSEKKTLNTCNHSPPSEVVRGCSRDRYVPNLHTSCIHVPMCSKIPQCTTGQPETTGCQQEPKCQSITSCSKTKRYAVLTARETVATQAKPFESMVCSHASPCIMIPKCLGRAMNGNRVELDAIPGCVHRPPCDFVPACCRRKATSQKVSASSQYPHSCRIV